MRRTATNCLLAATILTCCVAGRSGAQAKTEHQRDLNSREIIRRNGELRHLQSLRVTDKVDDPAQAEKMVEVIACCTKLRSLSFRHPVRLTRRAVALLSRLPILESLSMPAPLADPDVLQPLARMSALRELRLTGRVSVGVAKIVASMPGLTQLTLVEATPLVETIRILSSHQRLQTLRFQGFHGMSLTSRVGPVGIVMEHARALSKGFPALKNLEVRAHVQLTGEALELLLWRNLTGLTLDDCTGIKTFNFGDVLGASVQRLSLSRTLVDDRALASFRRNERLSSVNLAGCKNLTEDSLQTMTTWRNVKCLDLGGLQWVDDEALVSLECLKNLRELYLDDCTGVSTEGLLARSLGSLRVLRVSKTSLIDVGRVRKAMPRCEIVVVPLPIESRRP